MNNGDNVVINTRDGDVTVRLCDRETLNGNNWYSGYSDYGHYVFTDKDIIEHIPKVNTMIGFRKTNFDLI